MNSRTGTAGAGLALIAGAIGVLLRAGDNPRAATVAATAGLILLGVWIALVTEHDHDDDDDDRGQERERDSGA